jgi:hypothetical protein
MPRRSSIPYGPIIITAGEHAGRVGIYDDDEGRSDMIVYLYTGKPERTALDFMAATTAINCVTVRGSQVRIPSAAEGAAILALLQTEYSLVELMHLARGGLEALRVAGVDQTMSRRMFEARDLGLPPFDGEPPEK